MASHRPGLKIFKPCRKNSCSLCEKVDSSTIEEVNKEVTAIVVNIGGKRNRPYLKLTSKQKATIGQYATENGIVNAICHFKRVSGRFSHGKYV